MDQVYSRLATFRKIILSPSGYIIHYNFKDYKIISVIFFLISTFVLVSLIFFNLVLCLVSLLKLRKPKQQKLWMQTKSIKIIMKSQNWLTISKSIRYNSLHWIFLKHTHFSKICNNISLQKTFWSCKNESLETLQMNKLNWIAVYVCVLIIQCNVKSS